MTITNIPGRRRLRQLCSGVGRSGLATVLLVSSLVQNTSAQNLEPPEIVGEGRRQLGSLRTLASTKAAMRPKGRKDETTSRHRMNDQMTMAEYMDYLILKSDSHGDKRIDTKTDFVKRLALAEDEVVWTTRQTYQAMPTATTALHQGAVLAVSSLVLAAVASAFLTPKVFVDTLTSMASSLAVLVPWMWLGWSGTTGAFEGHREYLWVDVMAVFHIVSQQNFDNYVTQTILPLAWETFHKMLLVEAWKRVWRFVGKRLGHVLPNAQHQASSSSQSTHGKSAVNAGGLSSLFRHLHAFVDTAIRRGSQGALRRSVERNVQATVKTAVSGVVTYGHQAVTSLLLPSSVGQALSVPSS